MRTKITGKFAIGKLKNLLLEKGFEQIKTGSEGSQSEFVVADSTGPQVKVLVKPGKGMNSDVIIIGVVESFAQKVQVALLQSILFLIVVAVLAFVNVLFFPSDSPFYYFLPVLILFMYLFLKGSSWLGSMYTRKVDTKQYEDLVLSCELKTTYSVRWNNEWEG